MKNTGIRIKMDGVGRIVIPIEYREKLDLHKQDQVEIFLDGDRIILTKPTDSCIFCHSTRGLSQIKKKNVCATCLNEMNTM